MRKRDVVDILKLYNVGFGQRWVQSKTVIVGSKDTQLRTLQECQRGCYTRGIESLHEKSVSLGWLVIRDLLARSLHNRIPTRRK